MKKLLKKQGHKNVSFKYEELDSPEERRLKKERKLKNKSKARQLLWFVPPYSKQVDTSCTVGKMFFKILDECIPKEHPLYKMINRNKIKLSYRTSPNFGRIIKGLNKKV